MISKSEYPPKSDYSFTHLRGTDDVYYVQIISAFLSGFTLIQLGIAGATMKLAQSFQHTLENSKFSLIKYSGFAVVAIGVIALSSAITG
ncbi:hypothetical protein [Planktothrix mougeotii]|uniref:Uncharacterized protein n=1 Tax=Planktothrix mougeotii LEGE 06226 TaxID=1828728 RepID=A0ABR9U970_9CYAN|nr:hypothetical protein [Planktothrix mougeotii]MBE9143004.1 hypothetical protein [Planktothrix mougeotii LEGE 06226]